jgi:hypothetical protein
MELFAAIETTYGADDKAPDMSGEVVRGAGTGSMGEEQGGLVGEQDDAGELSSVGRGEAPRLEQLGGPDEGEMEKLFAVGALPIVRYRGGEVEVNLAGGIGVDRH